MSKQPEPVHLDLSTFLRSESRVPTAGRHDAMHVGIFFVHLMVHNRDRTTRYQRDD
jgi:hypothetical protein